VHAAFDAGFCLVILILYFKQKKYNISTTEQTALLPTLAVLAM